MEARPRCIELCFDETRQTNRIRSHGLSDWERRVIDCIGTDLESSIVSLLTQLDTVANDSEYVWKREWFFCLLASVDHPNIKADLLRILSDSS